MATDYDAPRKTDDELAEDSLEELKAQRANKTSSSVDVDEVELAENLELPGADLSDESLTVRVIPPQPTFSRVEGRACLSRLRLNEWLRSPCDRSIGAFLPVPS